MNHIQKIIYAVSIWMPTRDPYVIVARVALLIDSLRSSRETQGYMIMIVGL